MRRITRTWVARRPGKVDVPAAAALAMLSLLLSAWRQFDDAQEAAWIPLLDDPD